MGRRILSLKEKEVNQKEKQIMRSLRSIHREHNDLIESCKVAREQLLIIRSKAQELELLQFTNWEAWAKANNKHAGEMFMSIIEKIIDNRTHSATAHDLLGRAMDVIKDAVKKGFPKNPAFGQISSVFITLETEDFTKGTRSIKENGRNQVYELVNTWANKINHVFVKWVTEETAKSPDGKVDIKNFKPKDNPFSFEKILDILRFNDIVFCQTSFFGLPQQTIDFYSFESTVAIVEKWANQLRNEGVESYYLN